MKEMKLCLTGNWGRGNHHKRADTDSKTVTNVEKCERSMVDYKSE